jgi:RimJ/RimL family protein N-acetyltransferase
MPPIPVLRTPRLILDSHTEADLDEVAAIWADPVTTRHISTSAITRADSWGRILRYAGSWALAGFGTWAVRDAATGRLAGSAGLADQRRDIIPKLDGIPEMGWVLAGWAQGRGYATEAVMAAVRWADDHVAYPETCCLIDQDNLASLRVAEKTGYRLQGEGRLGQAAPLIFKRPRLI